jgi:hypothetical protein
MSFELVSMIDCITHTYYYKRETERACSSYRVIYACRDEAGRSEQVRSRSIALPSNRDSSIFVAAVVPGMKHST